MSDKPEPVTARLEEICDRCAHPQSAHSGCQTGCMFRFNDGTSCMCITFERSHARRRSDHSQT